MKTFDQAGAALLLAHEGQLILARAAVAVVKGWAAGLRTWLANMPATLPPTEPTRR